MAVRYEAVAQNDESAQTAGSDSSSPLPPTSQNPSTSPATPSPLPVLTFAEQAFTPLSVDVGDLSPSDHVGDRDRGDRGSAGRRSKSPGALEAGRVLRTARSMEQMRLAGNSSANSSNSTASAATPVGHGATIVSTMVQSFEALHASTTASQGYELLRSKSNGQRPTGPLSPPSTLSPSPSPSLSRTQSPIPARSDPVLDSSAAVDGGLGTPKDFGAAAQSDSAIQDTTAPQTAAAAATSNPHASAPTHGASGAHDSAPLPPPPSPPPPPAAAASVPDFSPPTAVAETSLDRPTPSTSQPPTSRARAISTPARPPLVRTSSTASVTISHPSPDTNKLLRSGVGLGSIAALEATAERLSMTSSIDAAIREEHNELKRSESRRSSILRANRARPASTPDNVSVIGQSQHPVGSRQNSIVGTNTAARHGGYSPGGYVMSPQNSLSATRLRSGSKASSTGIPAPLPESTDDAETGLEEYRFLPRHGPGKASTRSVASRLSLAQIAELEPPTSLTQEVLDEADRAAPVGEFDDEDEKIRASAHQFIEAEFADDPLPALDHELRDGPARQSQIQQPERYEHYETHPGDDERPMTSGSGATFRQAQEAFGDFDGVHCDPEAGDFALPRESTFQAHHPQSQRRPPPAPRPKSHFDPATGQQMLYYPAPVPAMLNLPPKLSKKPKPPARNMRRSQLMSSMPQASRESRVWLPDPVEGLHGNGDDSSFVNGVFGLGPTSQASASESGQRPGTDGEGGAQSDTSFARHGSQASLTQASLPEQQQRQLRLPQRLTASDNTKTRSVAFDSAPPQLRASAFFDLPSTTPKIEVKDCSAMATLDSILDASAAAPVSAFTDHVFAGKLGAEVYGPEKKKKKVKKKVKKTAAVPEPEPEKSPRPRKLVKRNSAANLLDPNTEKKRAGRFTLFGGKRAGDEESDNDGDMDDGDRRRPHSADGGLQSRSGQRSTSPDHSTGGESEEEEEEEEESEEEEELYQGPPTTLLAELQLRKQQQKLRTRPATHAYPNGMHSTLLELDAVAELERKARTGKRVTLAWEDPHAKPDQDSDEDEEIPLGMLYAAKAAGANHRASTMDIGALMSEVNRPLGLMERRELEDNEPLSRRRDRLQGKEPAAQVPLSLSVMQQRLSQMPGATPGGGLGLRSQSRLTLPLHQHHSHPASASRPASSAGGGAAAQGGGESDSEPEIPGETLAQRKARLAAENPLPRARPVSSTFSAELLSQFGGGADEEEPDKNRDKDDKNGRKKPTSTTPSHSRNPSAALSLSLSTTGAAGAAAAAATATAAATAAATATAAARTTAGASSPENPVPEEEETLGQRRRRLQREREAREREMAAAAPGRFSSSNNKAAAAAATALSLADVLAAHPAAAAHATDPRERERLRREQEAARAAREKEARLAAFRAQVGREVAASAAGTGTGTGLLGSPLGMAAGAPPQGGFMGGRFNDGLGGNPGNAGVGLGYGYAGGGMQRSSTMLGGGGVMGMGSAMGAGGGLYPGYGGGMGMGGYVGSTPNLGVYGNGGVGAGLGMGGGGGVVGGGMPLSAAALSPAGAGVGGGGGGGYGMMGNPQGQIDMVERWRQGVMP